MAGWPVVAAGQPARHRPHGRERRRRYGPGPGARWPRRVVARRRSGVAAHSERGQHLAGRVAGPLADRGQGCCAGQYRGHRHGQHRSQRVPSAASVAWVGDLGEVAEQVTGLLRCQRGGRSQPMGSRNGGWTGRHGLPNSSWASTTHMITGNRACSTSSSAHPPDYHQPDKPALCRGPGGRGGWRPPFHSTGSVHAAGRRGSSPSPNSRLICSADPTLMAGAATVVLARKPYALAAHLGRRKTKRTERRSSPRTGKHPRPAPDGLILQLGGHGHEPWLSVGDRAVDRCLGHLGGTAGQDGSGSHLAATVTS
jgi:hypothetical protein